MRNPRRTVRRSMLLCAIVLAGIPLHAGAAEGAGGMPEGAVGMMPNLRQVELTEQTAKAAVDAYLKIETEYGRAALPRIKPEELGGKVAVSSEVARIIEAEGFDDAGAWSIALVSVALAARSIRMGARGETDESAAKIDANPDLSAETKQQLKDMLRQTGPSANNVKVVTALMADAEYGPKLKRLRR